MILQALVGTEFDVLCQTDSFYEFCIFVSPIGQRCEFEWRRKVRSCFFVFSIQCNSFHFHPFFAEVEYQPQRLPWAGIAYKFRGNVQRAPMWDQSQECQAKWLRDMGLWDGVLQVWWRSGLWVYCARRSWGMWHPFYGLIMPSPSKNTRTIEQGQGSFFMYLNINIKGWANFCHF